MKVFATSFLLIFIHQAITFAQDCNFNVTGTHNYSSTSCSTTPNSITANGIDNGEVLIFDVNTTVSGNVLLGFNGSGSEVIIASGVTLRVQGDLSFNGSNGAKNITINGHLIVQGNFNAQGNITYGGNGTITTAQNWQNNDNSSVCSSPCNLAFEVNNCLQPNSPICEAVALYEASLPITLLSFTAEQQGATIQFTWQTAQETGNDFFTLEVSENGVDFEELTRIDAVGNSNTVQTYSQVVAYQAVGLRYFRLKQTDIGGEYSYSQSVAVRLRTQTDVIKVFRDVRQPQNIHLRGKLQETAQIRVLDAYGRIIYEVQMTEIEGEKIIQLPCVSDALLIVHLSSASVKKIIKL